MDSTTVFSLYEGIRNELPKESSNKKPLHVKSADEILSHAKCFFLDAFGVLNIGTKSIDGAREFIDKIRKNGLQFLVLTNSASYPKSHVCQRLNRVGFDFEPHEIVSSREVLFSLFPQNSMQWGVIGTPQELEISLRATFQGDDGFWESDGFLFLSTSNWDESWQKRFKKELFNNPRTLWVANPDITAPREDGSFSKEPGFYSLLESKELFENLNLVGKPYENVFSYAIHLAQKRWNIKPNEIMMIGDTLHTDILGANALGLQSALIEGYGFFRGLDTLPFMQKSGIFPDFRISSYM